MLFSKISSLIVALILAGTQNVAASPLQKLDQGSVDPRQDNTPDLSRRFIWHGLNNILNNLDQSWIHDLTHDKS